MLAGASDTDIRVTAGGDGPPPLPARGYPQGHGMRHKLRPDIGAYAKQVVAQDQFEVMAARGFSRMRIVTVSRFDFLIP